MELSRPLNKNQEEVVSTGARAGLFEHVRNYVAKLCVRIAPQAAEPPVRVQTNPSIQFVFEQQCGKNVAGDVAFATSKARFLSGL